MIKIKSIILIILLFLTANINAGNKLVCNIGVGDITPKDHVVLAGFAARKGLSTTIHRRLYSHCLVIKNRSTKLCIITNDLMEISKVYTDSIRKVIAVKTGVPFNHIFMNCIHTHSAPRTAGWCSEAGQPNFNYHHECFKSIIENAVSTINAPESNYKPFDIEVAKGSCMMNGNRCEKSGPIDRTAYAVRLIGKDKKPIVALLNYSCHPVSFGYKSLVVSPDYPAIACEQLSKEWKCPVFFFTGASGNVDPKGSCRNDSNYTAANGTALAESVQNASFKRLKQNNQLVIKNEELHLPYQTDTVTIDKLNAHVQQLLQMSGVSNSWKDDVLNWQKRTLKKIENHQVPNYLPFNIGSANVGGLLFLFSQGEPFNEYQSDLRNLFPHQYIIYIAYENGQNSYLPSAYAFKSDNKGYDYEKKEMHVYIDAPFPLSDKMPAVYALGIKDIIQSVIK